MTKKEKIYYYSFIGSTILLLLVLELLTTQFGPLLADTSGTPELPYIVSYLYLVCTMLAVFLAIRFTKIPMIVRMGMIAFAADFVLLGYYMFYETSHLYCLGILAVAYLMLLKPNRE